MKNQTVNSKSYEYILASIGDSCKIIGVEVKNNWLVAELSSGVYFWVKNNLNTNAQ